MGFHPKNSKPPIKQGQSTHVIDVFKRMAVDMKNRGFSDEQLSSFADDPTGDALGLKKNMYYDYIGHIFEEIKNRSSSEERYAALQELANEGKI